MRLKSNILLIKYLSLCFQFYQSGVFMSWLECMSIAVFIFSIFAPSLFCKFFILPALFHMLLYKDCKTKTYFYILIRKVGKSSLLKEAWLLLFSLSFAVIVLNGCKIDKYCSF